jgi:hypothetical protein
MPFKFLHILVTSKISLQINMRATFGVDHVKMFEQCSAAIANELEKQKDPGCPTIPCSVGSFKFEKALCDLGASVSVMPRDVFEKLRLPLDPTGMCLELGDNSILYPLGIRFYLPRHVGLLLGNLVVVWRRKTVECVRVKFGLLTVRETQFCCLATVVISITSSI